MCFSFQDTSFNRRRVKNHPEHRRPQERVRALQYHEFRWRRRLANLSPVLQLPRDLTNHRQGGARGFLLPVRSSVHTGIHVWILRAQILFITVQRIKPLSRSDLKYAYLNLNIEAVFCINQTSDDLYSQVLIIFS